MALVVAMMRNGSSKRRDAANFVGDQFDVASIARAKSSCTTKLLL